MSFIFKAIIESYILYFNMFEFTPIKMPSRFVVIEKWSLPVWIYMNTSTLLNFAGVKVILNRLKPTFGLKKSNSSPTTQLLLSYRLDQITQLTNTMPTNPRQTEHPNNQKAIRWYWRSWASMLIPRLYRCSPARWLGRVPKGQQSRSLTTSQFPAPRADGDHQPNDSSVRVAAFSLPPPLR